MTVANVRVTKILLKRGNSDVSSTYVGALSELTHDTTLQTLRVHDNVTPGGWLLATNAQLQAVGNAISIIGNIDLSLLANAATQQQQIDLINANVAAANVQIGVISYGNANVAAYLPNYGGPVRSDLVNFGASPGIAPPNVNGTTDLIRLYDFGNEGNESNYAIGVEGDHIWFNVDNNIEDLGYKFYGNGVLAARISATGNLFVNDRVTFPDSTYQTTAYLGAGSGSNQQLGTGDSVQFANVTADNVNISQGTLGQGVHIPASENQIYVSKNGNDSNDGSINSPFLTIKAALDYAGTLSAPAGVSVNVAPGIYHEDNPVTIPHKVSLMGDNLRNVTVIPNTPSADLFYVTNGCYVWGITIKDYLANGFSFDPTTPAQNVFVSPYIQNLTSSTTTGTAVYIDGSLNSAFSTKAMIVGFFTIINQGGKGIHIVNSGYSQLVNIYTIACDVGIKVESGAFCTLNGSDCSIGNYGLWAEGMGSLQTAGVTSGSSTAGVFTIRNLSPHLPRVNTVMMIDGDNNIYNIDTITPIDPTTATVAIQETYTQTIPDGTGISFYYRSAIVASAHTFEYVGAGTNPATALPQYGGIPIEANEVVQIGGGKVTYTSTDHKGNFKIGSNLTINQGTGTISGDAFNRSLFALMTPYILALEI